MLLYAAVIVHFTFLSTFTWLNVMSFDIWWTFRYVITANKRHYITTCFLVFIGRDDLSDLPICQRHCLRVFRLRHAQHSFGSCFFVFFFFFLFGFFVRFVFLSGDNDEMYFPYISQIVIYTRCEITRQVVSFKC